jgi:DNA-directed RNA polymerase beta subunit
MYVMIDRKRKIPATTFLRAFGYNDDEKIAEEFFDSRHQAGRLLRGPDGGGELHEFLGVEYAETVLDDAGKTIIERGQKVTKKIAGPLRKAG